MQNDRLKKTVDAGHGDRTLQDRNVTERVDLSDDERVAEFRQQFYAAALPKIPDIPGYHVCWLTTQNPRDTIQMRQRMGYEPILAKDVPGYDTGMAEAKTGEYAGFIAVNEMLACKIRKDLYLRYMTVNHHEAPRSEEARMAETADFIRERMRSSGSRDELPGVFEGDGFTELRKAPPGPMFE